MKNRKPVEQRFDIEISELMRVLRLPGNFYDIDTRYVNGKVDHISIRTKVKGA